MVRWKPSQQLLEILEVSASHFHWTHFTNQKIEAARSKHLQTKAHVYRLQPSENLHTPAHDARRGQVQRQGNPRSHL